MLIIHIVILIGKKEKETGSEKPGSTVSNLILSSKYRRYCADHTAGSVGSKEPVAGTRALLPNGPLNTSFAL